MVWNKLRDQYGVVILALFVLGVIVLYGIVGEDGARIVIADNLDLFQAQYQMLRNTHTWFAQGVSAPFLHGVTRDNLPSEWNLVSVLYMLLPPFEAYIANYLIKVVLAAVSFRLLAEELHVRETGRLSTGGYTVGTDASAAMNIPGNLALLGGLAYGLLNMFPAFGISFSSIPLLIWLLLRLDRAEGRRQTAGWLVLIFCYPFISYFSYFGIFILGYLCIAWLWITIARRHLQHRLFAAIVLLSLGYVVFEYRLFRSMLLTDVTTIRESMVIASLTPAQVMGYICDALVTDATMHTQSVQQYVVLPICVIALVVFNVNHVRRHEIGRTTRDPYNLIAAWILFNAVIYGLYYYEPFRSLVETLLPPLKGFQFNRTVFFNPFLWYAALYLVVYRVFRMGAGEGTSDAGTHVDDANGTETPCNDHTDRGRRGIGMVTCVLAHLAIGAAILVILLTPTADNDLYHTAHALAYRTVKGVEEDSLSYGEFYSTDLFELAKADIGYEGEWSAAYGFHPAILEYNGIATIDGYLGFYSQDYKDAFRKAIAPALDRQPLNAQYYDDWGARCYLYSGTEGTNVEAVRNYQHMEEPIYIDHDELAALDCRYIYARPELTNADEMGLTLLGTYITESSPYILHVYQVN